MAVTERQVRGLAAELATPVAASHLTTPQMLLVAHRKKPVIVGVAEAAEPAAGLVVSAVKAVTVIGTRTTLILTVGTEVTTEAAEAAAQG